MSDDDDRAKLTDRVQTARVRWHLAYEHARLHPSPESLSNVAETREQLDIAEDALHDFDFCPPTKV